MLVLSLCFLGVVAIAIYLSSKIEDEVFKVGMLITALAFSLVVLICAPWTIKLMVAAISALGSISIEDLPF
ncbi:MAG: hypothetical protein QNJ60_01025 [Xenococcaceae cyanobacterium MO_188.B19]|nr:hypothetical protein [Xenococcaceae cyanobacterium MO_188.B19]